MWSDLRGDLPGRNEDRRPRGLEGFLDLYPLLVWACVGLKMRPLVNIDSEIALKISTDCSFPFSLKWAAKDYRSSNNAQRHLKNSRPPVKPLAPMGDFCFLFSRPRSSPRTKNSGSRIEPCQHGRWRTESALTTDGTNVMDAAQSPSCCAT